MYPQTHFLFSYLIALIFAKFGIISYKFAFFAALVGLFIDIDHYIVYIFNKKNKGDFSLKHAWNRAVKGLYHARSFIHHEFGFVLITVIIVFLFFFNRSLFWVFAIGYYSHMFIDYAQLNVLKIRGKIKVEEFGLIEKISKFEVYLDIFLVIGIVLLIF